MRARTISSALRGLLPVLICLITGSGAAQWLPSGQTSGPIYYNGGNVGVGTASPGFLFHVESTLPSVLARIRNLSTSGSGLDLVTAATGTQTVLLTRGGDGGITSLSALANGNVGVGTANPQRNLAIVG